MNHTPTPYTVQGRNIHSLQFDEPLDERNIVATAPNDNPESLDNLVFIARECNSYNAMLEALKEIERNCAPWAKADNMAGRLSGIARAAIRKAEEP